MSHALRRRCKAEYDMVLALEEPTFKLKRQHVTLPFLYSEAIPIQMVLICSISSLISSQIPILWISRPQCSTVKIK